MPARYVYKHVIKQNNVYQAYCIQRIQNPDHVIYYIVSDCFITE